MSIALGELLGKISAAAVHGSVDRAVASVSADSRAVGPGALFIALRGEHADGHDFIAAAIARGAHAILAERAVTVPAGVTVIVVPDTLAALSPLAAAFYGNPSGALCMVGVTGTNGKTTTAHLIAAAIEGAGHRCAVIGTLGAKFRDAQWPLANTTPLALELHGLLAQLRDRGATHVAMEVSSHALALHRVDDIVFDAGVLTNVTRDHLDFHGTFEAYAAAKRRLFDLAPAAVLNADDPSGGAWAKTLPDCTTYAIDREASVRARALELDGRGSRFFVGDVPFAVHVPGRFNVANALAAIGAARTLGIDDRVTAAGLRSLAAVPGRMERIEGDGFSVIVDYAHTPDALTRALQSAREFTSGRVIAVFGAGGDRDRGKRPLMGRAAGELADVVVLTSDNPRSEAPAAILAEIAAGIGGAANVSVIEDRAAAIRHAVGVAARGDTVLIAGKGHEPYQIVGDRTLPFDDRAEARAALAALAGGPA